MFILPITSLLYYFLLITKRVKLCLQFWAPSIHCEMKSIEFFSKYSQSFCPKSLPILDCLSDDLQEISICILPMSLFHCAYMVGLWGGSFSDHQTKYYRHLSQVAPISSVAREQGNIQHVNPVSLAKKTVVMRSHSNTPITN